MKGKLGRREKVRESVKRRAVRGRKEKRTAKDRWKNERTGEEGQRGKGQMEREK